MTGVVTKTFIIAASLSITTAFADNNIDSNQEKSMKLEISAFDNGATIPPEYAYCAPATSGHVQESKNINPEIHWSNLPGGTQSLALIVVDPDVPVIRTNANQEGSSILQNAARQDFYHWVLVDIPVTIQTIQKGQDSNGTTIKSPDKTPYGINGINDYTSSAAEPHGGYDGPCPPWNDEAVHHYHFCLYALNIKTLGLSGAFDGKKALAAMKGHILAQSEWVGTYTLNPDIQN